MSQADLSKRKSNGSIRRASQGNLFDNNEKVTEQAEVSYPVFELNLVHTGRDKALSQSSEGTTYPNGQELAFHIFDEGEYIYGLKRAKITSTDHGRPATGGTDCGFVALNGMDVSPYGTSQGLTNSIYPIGPAKATYDMFDDKTNRTGTVARGYGSTSIKNVFIEHAYVGDRGIAFCPDVSNQRELNAYSYGGLGLDPAKKGKITPVMEVFDIKNVKYNELILAVKATDLNTDKSSVNRPYLDIIDNAGEFTPEEQSAAKLQHFIMSVAYAFYVVLSNRGIIRSNCAPVSNGGIGGFEYNATLASLTNMVVDTGDLLGGKLDNTAADYETIKYENDSAKRYGEHMSDEAFIQRRTDEELFMASLLGVIDNPSVKPTDTATLRTDIIKTAFAGATDETLYWPLLGGILEDEENITQGPNIETEQILLPRMIKNMLNVGHNLHQATVYLNKATVSKVIGESLSAASPGNQEFGLLTNGSNFKY